MKPTTPDPRYLARTAGPAGALPVYPPSARRGPCVPASAALGRGRAAIAPKPSPAAGADAGSGPSRAGRHPRRRRSADRPAALLATVALAGAVLGACGPARPNRPAAPAVARPPAVQQPLPAPRAPTAQQPAPRRHLAARRPPVPPPPPPSINVLEYHAVLPEAEIAADPTWRVDPYVMSRRRFAYQMAELAKAGYHALTARQFAAIWADRGRPLPSRTVMITFDDGYADTQRVAEPIMARHGFRGTLFMIGSLLGARSPWPPQPISHDPMLDIPELRVLIAAGWDIESHTFRLHLLPVHTIETVSEAAAAADLAREDRLLRAVAGATPVAFAYPEGVRSPGLFAAVKRDYRVAFVGGDRALTRSANPFLLPRWTMTAHSNLPWTLHLPPVPRRAAVPGASGGRVAGKPRQSGSTKAPAAVVHAAAPRPPAGPSKGHPAPTGTAAPPAAAAPTKIAEAAATAPRRPFPTSAARS